MDLLEVLEAEALKKDYLQWQEDSSPFNKIIEDLICKRDNQIKKVLEERGYVFLHKRAFEEFLKTRCKIRKIENSQQRVLSSGGRDICSWFETIDIRIEGNKVNIILGKI